MANNYQVLKPKYKANNLKKPFKNGIISVMIHNKNKGVYMDCLKDLEIDFTEIDKVLKIDFKALDEMLKIDFKALDEMLKIDFNIPGLYE